MTKERKLDALYLIIDRAFAEGKFVEVDNWIGQLDVDWLFRTNKSMLLGWMVTSSWASRRGIKMPNREKLSQRCRELMPQHKDWFDRMDEVDNGGPFAGLNLSPADVAWNTTKTSKLSKIGSSIVTAILNVSDKLQGRDRYKERK